MRIIFKITLFIISLAQLLSAQFSSNVSNVATTAAPFLEIGAGSRAVSMGGAFVATANDASAMYWNPAGLGQLNRIETIFVHTEWLAGISYDYAGLIIPLAESGTIGLNLISLSTDNMKIRTVDFPDGTGEFFDASSFSLGVTYGIKLTNRFAIGLNVKYISERIWKEKSAGFAVDIGTLYETTIPGLRIGASLLNFGTDLQMSGNDLLVYHDIDESQLGNNDRIFAEMKTDSWPLPLLFQFGIAYDVLGGDLHKVTIETDAVHPVNNQESIHAGFEYAFRQSYFIRGGYRNFLLPDSEEGLTLGAGINFNMSESFALSLDYAHADFGRLENTERFTLILRF